MTTYFLNVTNTSITITNLDTDQVVMKVQDVNDFRMFVRLMNPSDEMFASSSMDFPSEYTNRKSVVLLAEAIQNLS